MSFEYIKWLVNGEADEELRIKNRDTEWMLKHYFFKKLCNVFYIPDTDLFASQINVHAATDVPWIPDLSAIHTNTFTTDCAIRNPLAARFNLT